MGKKFKISGFDEDDKLFEKLDGILGDDPYDDLMGDGKKKKKKKKKDKDVAGDIGGSFKESLKELSKKELRAKCEEMGIDLDYIDRESKKSMRAAIMKARKESRGMGKIKKNEAAPVVVDSAPYYFDEKTREFVVCNAEDAPDITVFEAMRSLGALRRNKRKDDGFAELMQRITDQIKSGALDEKKDSKPAIADKAIDVEYTEVKDEKPAATTADVAKQFSKDVSDTLDDLKAKK